MLRKLAIVWISRRQHKAERLERGPHAEHARQVRAATDEVRGWVVERTVAVLERDA